VRPPFGSTGWACRGKGTGTTPPPGFIRYEMRIDAAAAFEETAAGKLIKIND